MIPKVNMIINQLKKHTSYVFSQTKVRIEHYFSLPKEEKHIGVIWRERRKTKRCKEAREIYEAVSIRGAG
jgi:hypothetical protein